MMVLCVFLMFYVAIVAQDCNPRLTPIPHGCSGIRASATTYSPGNACATQPYPLDVPSRSNPALTCAGIGAARLAGSSQTLPPECYCAFDIATRLAGLSDAPSCANSDVRISAVLSSERSCVQGTTFVTDLYASFQSPVQRNDIGWIINVDGGSPITTDRACVRGMFPVRRNPPPGPVSVYESNTLNILCPSVGNLDNDACGDVNGRVRAPIGFVGLNCLGNIGSNLTLSTVVSWSTTNAADCWNSIDATMEADRCIEADLVTNVVIVDQPQISTAYALSPTVITGGTIGTVTISITNTRPTVSSSSAFDPTITINSVTDSWFPSSSKSNAACNSATTVSVTPTSTLTCRIGTGPTFSVAKPSALSGLDIPAATTLQCTYSALFCGPLGASTTGTLTVRVTDEYGHTGSSTTTKTVIFAGPPPTLTFTLSPTSVTSVVSGTNVVTTGTVTNTGSTALTLVWSTTCAAPNCVVQSTCPATVAAGATVTCQFTYQFYGPIIPTSTRTIPIQVVGTTPSGQTVSSTQNLNIDMIASIDFSGTKVEPGGSSSLTATIRNTGLTTQTLTLSTEADCPFLLNSPDLLPCDLGFPDDPVRCQRIQDIRCTSNGSPFTLPGNIAAGQTVTCTFNARICGDVGTGQAGVTWTLGSTVIHATYPTQITNAVPSVSPFWEETDLLEIDPLNQQRTDSIHLDLTIPDCSIVETCAPSDSCTWTGVWDCLTGTGLSFDLATDVFNAVLQQALFCATDICDDSSPTVHVVGTDNEGSTFSVDT